ncbi:MAG: hypothetical protein ACPLZH_03325 [Minisyncoccales bacterium]
MNNWSVDENYLKQFPKDYEKWRLLQLINYGLDGEKISLKSLKKYWSEIKKEIVDEKIKLYLERIILGQ